MKPGFTSTQPVQGYLAKLLDGQEQASNASGCPADGKKRKKIDPPSVHNGTAAFLKRADRKNVMQLALKRLSQNYPDTIQSLQLSESSRLQLAKTIVANGHPATVWLAEYDKKRGVEPRHICGLVNHFREFAIASPQDRLQLAFSVANEVPKALAANISKFDIESSEDRLGLAKVIAKKSPTSLLINFKYFDIQDPRHKHELAEIVAEKIQDVDKHDVSDVARNIEALRIQEPELRFRIAKVLLEKLSSTPFLEESKFVRKFGIEEMKPEHRFELAKIYAERFPRAFGIDVDHFNIRDTQYGFEMAKILMRNDPSANAGPFTIGQLVDIQDSTATNKLYAIGCLRIAATAGNASSELKHFKNKFISLAVHKSEMRKLSFPEGVSTILGERHPVLAHLLPSIEGEQDADIRNVLSTWAHVTALSTYDTQLPEASWHVLTAQFDAIRKLRAPAMRYRLTDLLANQCLPAGQEFFAFSETCRKPHTRLLPIVLFPISEKDGMGNDVLLSNFIALLSQAKYKGNRIATAVKSLQPLADAALPLALKRQLLQAVFPAGAGETVPKQLIQSLQSIACLMTLIEDPETDLAKDIRQKLEGIRTQGDLKEAMNHVFKRLFALGPDAGQEDLVERFFEYNNASRYPNGLIIYAASWKESGDEETDDVIGAVRKFVEALLSPDPHAFKKLRYAPDASAHLALLHERAPEVMQKWQEPCPFTSSTLDFAALTGKEPDVFDTLRRCLIRDRHVAEGTYPLLEQVLQAQVTPEQAMAAWREQEARQAPRAGKQESALQARRAQEKALLQLLSDSTLSVHDKSTLLNDCLSSMGEEQFRADLKALKALLDMPPDRDFSQYRVELTDAPEDLFLANTEVPNCQSITGGIHGASYNQALMDEVLNGAVCMAVAKGPDGKIQAHRTLRLLWNPNQGRTVLHLEQGYDNSLPGALTDALVDLARQKARQLGCALVTHDSSIETTGKYPDPLEMKDSPAPYAYVDSGGGLKENGTYTLNNARIIHTA